MPYTTITTGTITAAWANANVRDQVVTPFASVAARDSAITSPVNGMVCVTTDTGMMWQYTGLAWVAMGTSSAWTTYTPTWTASTTNPVIGNGTLDGAYQKVGRMVSFRARLAVGSTTTNGTGTYFLTVPVATGAANPPQLMTALLYDASTANWYTWVAYLPTNSSTLQFPTGDGTVAQFEAGTPVTLANGDLFIVSGTYEAAS